MKKPKAKETLLQKAKQARKTKHRFNPSDEFMELTIGWLKSEINLGQACNAVGKSGSQKANGGNIIYKFAVTLKGLYEKGKLKIV